MSFCSGQIKVAVTTKLALLTGWLPPYSLCGWQKVTFQLYTLVSFQSVKTRVAMSVGIMVNGYSRLLD